MEVNENMDQKEEQMIRGAAAENVQENAQNDAWDNAQNTLEYYREAYERERQKSNELAVRLAASQNQVQELNDKINQNFVLACFQTVSLFVPFPEENESKIVSLWKPKRYPPQDRIQIY